MSHKNGLGLKKCAQNRKFSYLGIRNLPENRKDSPISENSIVEKTAAVIFRTKSNHTSKCHQEKDNRAVASVAMNNWWCKPAILFRWSIYHGCLVVWTGAMLLKYENFLWNICIFRCCTLCGLSTVSNSLLSACVHPFKLPSQSTRMSQAGHLLTQAAEAFQNAMVSKDLKLERYCMSNLVNLVTKTSLRD